MNFTVSNSVAEVLTSLHEAGFDWIAEEIQITIRNGNAVENVGAARRATVPFGHVEQEAILLGVLREYFVGVESVLADIKSNLPELLGQADLEVEVLNEDGAAILTVSPRNDAQLKSAQVGLPLDQIQSFDQLLRSAWPADIGVYPRRFRAVPAIMEEE